MGILARRIDEYLANKKTSYFYFNTLKKINLFTLNP